MMDASSEQPAAIAAEPVSSNEQEHNEEAMEETEEYSYDGDEYRHFVPRGRGGFRCVYVSYSPANKLPPMHPLIRGSLYFRLSTSAVSPS